jgi:hypothetical protein
MLLTASCVGALIAGRCPEFVSGHVDLVLSLVVFAMHWDWGAVPLNSKIKSQQVHMTISSPVSIVSLTRQFHFLRQTFYHTFTVVEESLHSFPVIFPYGKQKENT